MTVSLAVTGTEPNRMYGAHVHVLACDAGAGGHYRNDADAGATATNEVWLDFMSDAKGAGTALATTSWPIHTGKAHSVVIHDHTTAAGGAAGAKLTCIDVGF
jgi:Cu-Zn family superoxide dismutase